MGRIDVTRDWFIDTVYTFAAVGTLLVGLVALSAGVPSEIVKPLVLAGAVIVGMISLYWLLRGGEEGIDS